MNRPIFRKEALARLASPEQLDQLLPLTSPRGWLALGAAVLVLVLLLLWGFFGTLAIEADAQGVLLRPGGVRQVLAPDAGTVARVAVRSGDEVKQGQELLRLAPPSGGDEARPVTSPLTARVLGVLAQEGDPVEKKAQLLRLEVLDQPLVAILYLPADDGYRPLPEMKVRIAPTGARGTEFAVLEGRVKSTSRFPSNRPALLRGLPGEEWAQDLTRSGPCLEVVVEIVAPPGERFAELYSGTPCRGRITLGRLRPIQFLFPSRRDHPGS